SALCVGARPSRSHAASNAIVMAFTASGLKPSANLCGIGFPAEPKSMQIQIDDEAMQLLRDRMLGDCYVLVAAEGFFEASAETITDLLRRVLVDFPHDLFECVALPAGRAGYSRIGLRISRTLKRDIALRAFNIGCLETHNRLQC